VAFCYDSNAFWNKHLPPELRVVVIDNGGGNIFRYIDGPDRDPDLLPWFESPHGRNIPALVAGYGLACFEAHDADTLANGLDALYKPYDKPAVLLVKTDAEVAPRMLKAYFAGLHNPPGA
jgi:2-succinyl-5-enolpyruvyl-6-hydroxy-3-cyclohexene-1-carboxylate synthase